MKKTVFSFVVLVSLVFAFSSCEKEEDYGPTFFDLEVDGEKFSFSDEYVSAPGSETFGLFILAGKFTSDAHVTITLNINEAGDYIASDVNSTPSLDLWKGGKNGTDRNTLYESEFEITNFIPGKVYEGSFSGYINLDGDEILLEGDFRVVD